MTPPDPAPRPRITAGSIALICIGLLIFVPSGLCTAVVVTMGGPAEAALVIGGPFIAIGWLLVWWGLGRDRR